MNSLNLPLQNQYQPEGEFPEKGYLLIMLHGRGDSSEGFIGLKEQLSIPNLSVLLLDAPDDYYGGYSWYELAPNQGPGILRSRKVLEETFVQLQKLGFESKRIFLMGFSQGCLMTLEFGGRWDERLAGYIGISGYAYDPEALLKDASSAAKSGDWLLTHGTKDDVLPVERTRAQMEVLKKGGFHLDYIEFKKTHTIDERDEFPMIRSWIKERAKG